MGAPRAPEPLHLVFVIALLFPFRGLHFFSMRGIPAVLLFRCHRLPCRGGRAPSVNRGRPVGKGEARARGAWQPRREQSRSLWCTTGHAVGPAISRSVTQHHHACVVHVYIYITFSNIQIGSARPRSPAVDALRARPRAAQRPRQGAVPSP